MICRNPLSLTRLRGPILAVLIIGFLLTDLQAQVPTHSDRIRETAEEILSRPEFQFFQRIEDRRRTEPLPGEGEGVPRLRSTRELPQNGRNVEQLRPNQPPQNPGGPRPDANFPDGPKNGEGIGGVEDALEREDFPEARELENRLKNPNGNEVAPLDLPENPADNEPNPVPADILPNENNPNGPPPRFDFGPNEDPKPKLENPLDIPEPREAGRELPVPRSRESIREKTERVTSATAGVIAQIVGFVFQGIAWGTLAVICGLIGWLIIKAILEMERPQFFRRSSPEASEPSALIPVSAPGEIPADVYVTRAKQLAHAGNYREAVVQLLLGTLSRVERAGWVRFRQGMTARDYLSAVREHPVVHRGLGAIIKNFEPLSFGRREPTATHFERSLNSYEAAFGSE